jgi:quercetin dioxygenase-like cupin family protein
MARPGDTIESRQAGDRITFLRTGTETNGELLEADLFIGSGGEGPPEHIHPSQEERFVVLSGSFTVRTADRDTLFNAGEECVVSAGTPHRWWNAGDEEAHIRLEFRPSGRIDRFLEAIYGMDQDGKLSPRHFLQIAVVLSEFRDADIMTSPPLFVQRILFGFLAGIGRLCGYRPDYPYPYAKRAV